MYAQVFANVSTRYSKLHVVVIHQILSCPQIYFVFFYAWFLYGGSWALRQMYSNDTYVHTTLKFFTLLGEDGRSKKSASSEPPPKKAEASRDRDQGLPSKEKGSTPEPLDTATGESAGGGGGEAKKLREAEREATGGGGSSAGGGEGEQATVAEQGDQEQGHRDSSEEPGV